MLLFTKKNWWKENFKSNSRLYCSTETIIFQICYKNALPKTVVIKKDEDENILIR